MTRAHDARSAGTHAAHNLIVGLADAGMSADRIDAIAKSVLGTRHGKPAAVSDQFYAAFDTTASIYVADLRDLEAG